MDDRPLSGSVGVIRELCVSRRGALVPALNDALDAIQDSCQFWGGFADIILPSDQWDGTTFLEPWVDVAIRSDVDRWEGIDGEEKEKPDSFGDGFPYPVPMAVVFAALDRPRDSLVRIRVPQLDQNDPWFISYLALFGSWPESPDTKSLDLSSLRRDLSYDDLIPTEFEPVVGSWEDVLDRLQDPGSAAPATISRAHLSVDGGEVETNILPATPYWSSAVRRATAREFGPNLVVVYEPGSLADLCLIWSLRVANGALRGAPIAIPVEGDVLDQLRTHHVTALFRFFGLRSSFGLTSLSVSTDRLTEIRDSLGEPWEVVDAQEVLRPARPPGFHSTATAHFDQGSANIGAWPDGENDLISRIIGAWSPPPFRLRVRPSDRILPPSRSLAADPWIRGYRAGYHANGTPRRGEIVEIRWPTGWTVLEALARDEGLMVQPSAAGKAAAALIETLGGTHEFEPISSPVAFDFLSQIASRSSRQLSIGDVVNYLGVKTAVAKHWLIWAESRGLVVRGAQVRCRRCGARSWRALRDIAPPVTCYGCGIAIERPFPPDRLEFKYRLSETLSNALECDALPHVLVFAWLAERYRAIPGNLSVLNGMYPGVDVIGPSGERIGEVDLLAVFHDGVIALGECKMSGVGLSRDSVEKLDHLADAISAEWTFVATPDGRADCPPIWRESLQGLPQRPRYGFTGENLFDTAIRTAKHDPFDWESEELPSLDDVNERYRQSLMSTCEWLMGQGDPDQQLREAWARDRLRRRSKS